MKSNFYHRAKHYLTAAVILFFIASYCPSAWYGVPGIFCLIVGIYYYVRYNILPYPSNPCDTLCDRDSDDVAG